MCLCADNDGGSYNKTSKADEPMWVKVQSVMSLETRSSFPFTTYLKWLEQSLKWVKILEHVSHDPHKWHHYTYPFPFEQINHGQLLWIFVRIFPIIHHLK